MPTTNEILCMVEQMEVATLLKVDVEALLPKLKRIFPEKTRTAQAVVEAMLTQELTENEKAFFIFSLGGRAANFGRAQ